MSSSAVSLECTWGTVKGQPPAAPVKKTTAPSPPAARQLGCASCGSATANAPEQKKKPEAPNPPPVNPHTQLIPVQNEKDIRELQKKFGSISVLCTMDGCGWCKKMLPEAEKTARSPNTMPIAHLKAGPQSAPFLKSMGIRAFPTVCNLRASQSVIAMPGFKTAEKLAVLVAKKK